MNRALSPVYLAGQPTEKTADMAWFVTIGYGDSAGYEQTGSGGARRAHAGDKRLRERGR